jgi:hypothetical protein
MPPIRVRFRPPGLKPWTRIGTLGPFRGRMGIAWVVAPIVVGAILIAVAWFTLIRSNPPGAPFVRVAPADVLAVSPRTVPSQDGSGPILVGIGSDGLLGAVSATPCHAYPLKVYRGTVYVDPKDPGPCPATG